MNDSHQRITAAVIVAALLAGISAARLVKGGVTLDVRHLDLSSPEVAAQVYSRIEKSAALVCRDSTSPWDGARQSTWKRCVAAAVEAAVRQANAPALTAFHQTKKQRSELAGLRR